MKKSSERKAGRILLVTIIFLIFIIVGPLLINHAYKQSDGIATVWNGSDMLSYYGAIFGATGTIILGYVAWQQNQRLLKLEESSFVAENVGVAFLTEVKISGIKTTVCSPSKHAEQIVATGEADNASFSEYGSISLECKLKPSDDKKHIALIHVKSVLLFTSNGEKKRGLCFEANEVDNAYSKAAISDSGDQFLVTIIMSKNEKNEFVNSLQSADCVLHMDLDLLLLTDKYVETNLKCRATLSYPDYDDEEGIYSRFVRKSEAVSFWGGASIKSKDDVIIKN